MGRRRNAARSAARRALPWSILPDSRPSVGRGVPRAEIGNWAGVVKQVGASSRDLNEAGAMAAMSSRTHDAQISAQNLKPTPPRTALMLALMFETVRNWTNSYSARWKTLDITRKSVAIPAE